MRIAKLMFIWLNIILKLLIWLNIDHPLVLLPMDVVVRMNMISTHIQNWQEIKVKASIR